MRKKFLAILLTLLMVLQIAAPALTVADGELDNLTWDFTVGIDYLEGIDSLSIGPGNIASGWLNFDWENYEIKNAYSSDPSIAAIYAPKESDGWAEDVTDAWDSKGNLYIKGVSAGNAYIVQQIGAIGSPEVLKTVYLPVTVGDVPYVSATGVTITEGYTYAATVGTPFTLTGVVSPEDATYNTVTWSTDNEAVATVSQSGNVVTVTPVAAGTVDITATCDGPNPHSAVCTVTVTAPEPIESGNVRVYNGETFVSGHDTLAEAISAASTGNTVKLFADVDVTQVVHINSGKAITLDLNGKTITATAGSYGNSRRSLNVTGNASLTIIDGGEGGSIVVSGTGNTTAVYVESGSSFELAGGTIEVNNVPGPSNWWQNNNVYGVQNNGTTVISGGTVYVHTASTNYAVNCAGGTLSVTGGTIKAGNEQNTGKAPYAIYRTGGTVTVTGGTVEVDDRDTYGWSEGHLVYGTASVTGGKFKSAKQIDYDELEQYKLDSGYMLSATDADDYRAVVSAVAKIGETKYTTLEAAVAAATTGQTIELLSGITGTQYLTDGLKNKSITISGNKTLTSISTSDIYGFYFGDKDANNNPATDKLILSGLTMSKSGGNYTTLVDALEGTLTNVHITGTANTTFTAANGAQVTLENCVFVNEGSHTTSWRNTALSVQGIGDGPSVLTVKSGSYTSANGYAVYIFSSGGTVNIEGGTFSGKLMSQIDRNTYHEDYNRSIINISGGTFNNVVFEVSPNASDYAKITITGGTFDADPSAYVAEGYEAVAQGTSPETWRVQPEPVVLPEATVSELTTAQATELLTGEAFDIIPFHPGLSNTVLSGEPIAIRLFTSDQNESEATSEFFEDWYADFAVSFNKDITAYDITLDGTTYTTAPVIPIGYYEAFGDYVVGLAIDKNLDVGEDYWLLADGMGFFSGGFSAYPYIRDSVRNFFCGAVLIDDAFLDDNPSYSEAIQAYAGLNQFADDLEMTVKLRIYSPANVSSEDIAKLEASGYTLNEFTHNGSTRYYIDIQSDTFDIIPTIHHYEAQIGDVKYETLAAAVAAANATTGATIKLLEDIDFSTEAYAGYKWAGSTYNPLEITGTNTTLDLNGHTISEMGNCALVVGHLLAKDGRVSGITIKNGTLKAGKTGDVTNSYVLGIAGGDNIVVENVTTVGGINVYTGSQDVVIKNCSITGTKYYTVCAQTGSSVIIRGTTYTKNTDNTVANKSMFWTQGASTDSDCITPENPTGAFDASSITIEDGKFRVDETNGGKFFLGSGLNPIVKGGIYNIDPSTFQGANCVAEGYRVISNLDSETKEAYPYMVVKVESTVNDNTNTVAVQEVTYGDDQTAMVITEGNTSAVVTIDADIDSTVSGAGSDVDSYINVPKVLANAIETNGVSVEGISSVDVTLSLRKESVETSDVPSTLEAFVNNETAVFELHPVATVTINGTSETYDVSNSELATGAQFTTTLSFGSGAAYKKVTLSHYSTDGVLKNTWTATADGNGDVTVTLSSFSYILGVVDNSDPSFTPVSMDAQSGIVNFVSNVYLNIQDQIYYTVQIHVNEHYSGLDSYIGDNWYVEYTYGNGTAVTINRSDFVHFNETTMKQTLATGAVYACDVTGYEHYYELRHAVYMTEFSKVISITLYKSDGTKVTLYAQRGLVDASTNTYNWASMNSAGNYQGTTYNYLSELAGKSGWTSTANALTAAGRACDLQDWTLH